MEEKSKENEWELNLDGIHGVVIDRERLEKFKSIEPLSNDFIKELAYFLAQSVALLVLIDKQLESAAPIVRSFINDQVSLLGGTLLAMNDRWKQYANSKEVFVPTVAEQLIIDMNNALNDAIESGAIKEAMQRGKHIPDEKVDEIVHKLKEKVAQAAQEIEENLGNKGRSDEWPEIVVPDKGVH